jgi:catechol 2,3-dioxygenase-like lactoylglutathione lyase family enzyme
LQTAVDALQHINLRSADVDRSRRFYVEVIGLEIGPRPPLASNGYWLYLGGVPVIHLVQQAADGPSPNGSGAVDHVAFHGVDFDATRHRFSTLGIPFREAVIPRDGTRQLFVHDPDDVKIELNFDPAERNRES